jgi:hypothetical protein
MSLDPKSLHVGQTVTVTEMNYGVLLNLPQEGETGLTIRAINQEYLVLEAEAGGIRSIPIYLIHKPAAKEVENSEAA